MTEASDVNKNPLEKKYFFSRGFVKSRK